MLVCFGIKLLLVLESDVLLRCCILSSSNATDNRGLAKSFQFHFLDVLLQELVAFKYFKISRWHSALVSRLSCLGSSPGWGHCVVFLGKTLYSHIASSTRCINGYRQIYYYQKVLMSAYIFCTTLSPHGTKCIYTLGSNCRDW